MLSLFLEKIIRKTDTYTSLEKESEKYLLQLGGMIKKKVVAKKFEKGCT